MARLTWDSGCEAVRTLMWASNRNAQQTNCQLTTTQNVNFSQVTKVLSGREEPLRVSVLVELRKDLADMAAVPGARPLSYLAVLPSARPLSYLALDLFPT
eukprot:890462-Rhodomonas_salina.1